MRVKALQTKIVNFATAWDKKRGHQSSQQTTFNHLIEEVGELARQYVNQHSRPDQYNPDELDNAIGDTFIQIVKLAQLRRLDIEKLITKIIDEEQKLLNVKK